CAAALFALRTAERDRGQGREAGSARRPARKNGGLGACGRRPPAFRAARPWHLRRPGGVVGRALDPRSRRGPPRGIPARGGRRRGEVSEHGGAARRARATAILAAAGLDPEAVGRGELPAAAVLSPG